MMRKKILSRIVLTGLITTSSSFMFLGQAKAGLDPELAQLASRNKSGPYLGATAALGQARLVGKTSPGTLMLGAIEGGYIMAQGSWSRLEGGIEIGTGQISYSDRHDSPATKVDLNLRHYLLAKVGYGYSVGDHIMAIWRFGFGPGSVNYRGESGGQTLSSDNLGAVKFQLGADLSYTTDRNSAWYGGLRVSQIQYVVSEANLDGVAVSGDRNQVVNTFSLQFGLRYLL